MNKSLVTNLVALVVLICGYTLNNPILFSVGLFAFSGAITNWLAIHMLFEKVPGFYGSGVIPSRFEEIKQSIANLMMVQFFSQENIDKFLGDADNRPDVHLAPILDKLDLSPAFDRLVQVIMSSSFGSMLGMFGGVQALDPLREPFIENMKQALVDISQQPEFIESVRQEIDSPEVMSDIQQKIEAIIQQRLDELTPQLVKQMVQNMISEHLGWLVIWGGVFGGFIGLIAAMITK